MKGKRRWVVWAGLVLGLIGVAIVYSARREPVFEGAPISLWLRDCDFDQVELGGPSKQAVRALGTNVLPRLIELLQSRDSYLKHKLMGNCIEFRALGCRVTAAYCNQVRAAAACRVLGVEASPAIPQLIELIRIPVINRGAGLALVSVGPAAIEALLAELANPNADHRAAAVAALSQFTTNAPASIPYLAKATHDADLKVRTAAVLAFQSMPLESDPLIVHTLAESTHDTDATIRRYSVVLLAGGVSKSRLALAAVQNATIDSDAEVRRVAQLVIRDSTRTPQPDAD